MAVKMLTMTPAKVQSPTLRPPKADRLLIDWHLHHRYWITSELKNFHHHLLEKHDEYVEFLAKDANKFPLLDNAVVAQTDSLRMVCQRFLDLRT